MLKMPYQLFIFLIIFILAPFGWTQVHAKERLISLKPNVTEILFDLGAGNEIVGATTYCDYPSQAKKIDRVADYVHVNVEKVMHKNPTLVIGSEENSLKKEVEFLRGRGIRVELFPFGRLSEISQSIRGIGRLVHREERANQIALQMEKDLQELSQRRLPRSERILLVVGSKPFVVVGGRNLLDDLVVLLGGTNVAGESRLRYPTYSFEQIIGSRADIIIDMGMGSEAGAGKDRAQLYEKFSSLPAVAGKKIYFMDVEEFRPSPRLILGAKKLADVLQSAYGSHSHL